MVRNSYDQVKNVQGIEQYLKYMTHVYSAGYA